MLKTLMGKAFKNQNTNKGSRDDEEGKKVDGGGGQKRLLNEMREREREKGTEKMVLALAWHCQN